MKITPLLLAEDLPPLLPSCVHYAGSERFIEKALALQKQAKEKFDIAFDLEDGASVGDEKKLLKRFIELLDSGDRAEGRVGVRVHALESGLTVSEIEALIKKAGSKISFLTLPKAAGRKEVAKICKIVAAQSKARKLKKPIPLHVLIETRSALHEVSAIAELGGVEALDFGLLDFISDHGVAIPEAAMQSPGQFEHQLVAKAKVEIAAAALRFAKVPSHNVSIELKDPEKVFADAARARNQFGFLRMWSIHPVQIEPIQRAMRPDFSKLDEAKAILELAQAAAWAPIRYQDRLYDRASYRRCYELVRRAQLHRGAT